MSIQFIQERKGARHLTVASRQQKQISYFTQSDVQDDITLKYIQQYAQRNYRGNDYFLNWVKMIFRQPNFLSFYKYMRYPLPSAKLINDEIKPQLKRVYFADDSYFKYLIKGKQEETPEELDNHNFESKLFNAILFNYNDVIIHDLYDVNSPYREMICIDDVVSIESKDGKIQRIAYRAETTIGGELVVGYLYADKDSYKFYNSGLTDELLNIPHDLGMCPATWVSNEPFKAGNDIVRKSMFSYLREEMEEYVFLYVLRKMTEPNGAIPITVQLKIPPKEADGKDINGLSGEPMSLTELTAQKASVGKEVQGSDNNMQAGTNIKVPIVKDNTGKVNTDIVQQFAKFYYIPIEALDYINKRLYVLEQSIIINVLGDYLEQNNEIAKNEYQVSKSFTNKQDKLRYLAMNMTWTRTLSDSIFLGLKYGKDKVKVDIFYGSDFYLDNESELYTMFQNAPNQIERRNLLQRIGKTKYRFNKQRAERETILYTLLPFVSDKDFSTALEQQIVDEQTKQLQLRFTYWISLFEAEFGDITIFYNNLAASNSEKLVMINNLIFDLIKETITPVAKDLA